MTKSEAIKEFLSSVERCHPLAQRYDISWECQVNVSPHGGERVTGTTSSGKKWGGFTDGSSVWKHFRIPWAAGSEPHYTDGDLNFNLDKYVEAIGFTGFDWIAKRSLWVAFDFDSTINHNAGLSKDELDVIRNAVTDIPWCSCYSSTSGTGLHIYVYIKNSPEINNHTDHAAFARAILQKLAGLVGLPLGDKVDIAGGNMWVWRRGCSGFEEQKRGEELDGNSIPDWREHLTRVNKRGKRKTITDSSDSWESINNSQKRDTLDTGHRTLLRWLEDNNKLWWWDDDHWMLVTHTAYLRAAHEELKLKGLFDTHATGKEEIDQNCFAFPLSHGSWVVRRHSPGCKEHPLWRTDRSGWTYIYYNRTPTVESVASVFGVENKPGTYTFKSLSDFRDALRYLNIDAPEIPNEFSGRRSELKQISSGKLHASWQAREEDMDQPGWVRNKGRWERTFSTEQEPSESYTLDTLLRNVVASGKHEGWFVHSNGRWIEHPKSHLSEVLLASGISRGSVPNILGESILQPWELVNKPFQEEYPGNREWNKFAPQYACRPEYGDHPTWDLILNHIGQHLDPSTNKWCVENEILTGYEYLLFWCASLLQQPAIPLPYVFLYGPQNCGKSILHEALHLLFAQGRGYIRADVALTSTSNFNGELAGTVLCVVEEVNVRQNKNAYDKIKDWVTGRTITIHAKGKQPYDISNTTHWIQCGNDISYCPIFSGDTRIVVVDVPALGQTIAKNKLLADCDNETGAFLQTCLDIVLPDSGDRLGIPCISTTIKEQQQEANETYLEKFIGEYCYSVSGQRVEYAEFYAKFYAWIPTSEQSYWTSRRVSQQIPPTILRGKMGNDNKTYLGNISFNKDDEILPRLRRSGNRLVVI